MNDVVERLAGALPSWNAGPARDAILEFVVRVTERGSEDFVPREERVAVFDNDGTLWCEMPVPVQAFFVDGRLRALAPDHPEWRDREPFRSALARDREALARQGDQAVAELAMATHAGMTTDEFDGIVRQWLATARHPGLRVPHTRAVYQPMLELLGLLRAWGFATFIVSGGGVEFMRVFAGDVYGVPPQQVIGSTIRTHFEERGQVPVLVRDPRIEFVDDGAGKPVAIHRAIGRRPIACFGNSDGDREMLLWTTAGRTDGHPSLGVIVHHTDAAREFGYDRDPVPSGRLDRALDEAPGHGWIVVDMRVDWRDIFPPFAGVAAKNAPSGTRANTKGGGSR
ncbi:HAD family hydrolase [Longimicrobium sp.]|uniref:HAD family hydrolase n=1 Tax=Longimicrobium sp. TaxID=2029185 RepID=UPI002E328180|nr:HAD family hydrolase [Longimicrobium sp.]HEX6041527.1 HAD family hydrolase [Longimicrobium sp.]